MNNSTPVSKHTRIQQAILAACSELGIEAIQEHGRNNWRADVYIPNNGKPIAFEIQLSPQSLNRTLERQAKYIRDKVIGCWLFEKPVAKLNKERPDLPLFYVEDPADGPMLVNLGDRRKVELSTFIQQFIAHNIQFRSVAITKTTQSISLVFHQMQCWKCKAMNHIYYVDNCFYSACNAAIQPEEAIWESNKMEFRPEIIELAYELVASRKEQDIKLGSIKKRYSHTIENSYTSFGCYQCDSIFGDWFVMEAQMGVMYEPKELSGQGNIELKERIELPIPHWCFPDGHPFCTASSLQHSPLPNRIPDALLTLIEQYDPEEYQLSIQQVSQQDSKAECVLQLNIISEDPLLADIPRYWRIEVMGFHTGNIHFDWDSNLEIMHDHPLLWKFNDQQASLYFQGSCTDAAALLLDLCTLNEQLFDGHHSFPSVKSLYQLLQQPGGLLSNGPEQLLNEYAMLLTKYGMEPSIIGQRAPSTWNGQEFILNSRQAKICRVGNSYLIGEDFIFTPIDDNHKEPNNP